MVALLTSVRNSPCFGGLRRTKTCHWQLFARPSRKFVPAGTAHSVCFLVTFCTTQKVTTRFPYGKAPRFCKPRISTPQPQLRTATIKTFLREIRGFANLEGSKRTLSKAARSLGGPLPLRLSSAFTSPKITQNRSPAHLSIRRIFEKNLS